MPRTPRYPIMLVVEDINLTVNGNKQFLRELTLKRQIKN